MVAIEAHDYPIAGVMFHPETQTIEVHSVDKKALNGKVNNNVTDQINFYFSKFVKDQTRPSLEEGSHRFPDPETALKSLYISAGIDLHLMYTSQVLTYGVN